MSQKNSNIVPKFGSFKPKPSANSVPEAEPQEAERSDDRHHRHGSASRSQHERKRSRSPENDRRRHHGRHRNVDAEDRRRDTIVKRRDPSPQIAQDEFTEFDLFIIDRRGDKKNVEYGSIHRYDVPAHYRYGNGRVLGTSRHVRIDRDATTEKQIVLQSVNSHHDRSVAKPLSSKFKPVATRNVRVIIPQNGNDILLDNDYIKLRPSLKRRRDSQSPESTDEGMDYRAIDGKAKPTDKPADDDLEYTTDSDNDNAENIVQKEAREINAAFNRRVKDDPSNVDSWLALIDHQANMVHPGGDALTFTASEKGTLTEIRLTIYERVLKKVGKASAGYDKLVLGQLKEGSTIWENMKLATKWTEALNDHPNSIDIWLKYLDFVQTDYINFRYEKCKEAYIDSLRMLSKAHYDASPQQRPEICSAQLYVLRRLTSFIRDAGYGELAYATWQVSLEYHFFRPPEPASNEEELESLEAFWESDVPRIGESGALGWSAFVSGHQCGTRTPQSSSTEPDDGESNRASFAEDESSRMNIQFLPAAADDVDSDDPFRFVMFADLKDIAETLLNDLPKMDLIDAFLCFMRLPPLHPRSTTPDDSYRLDPFLGTSSTFHMMTPSSLPQNLDGEARIANKINTPYALFLSAFKDCKGQPPIALFVAQVLERSVLATPESEKLAEYYLAFELAVAPDQAEKKAKRLLKARPTSLRLYNAYALIEANLGHLDKALQVWSMALGMSSGWSQDRRQDTILLVHSRMMTLIAAGQEEKAINCLVGSDGPGSTSLHISATKRLKTTRMLEQGFDAMRSRGTTAHAALHVDCLVWLSYLMDGYDVAAAIQTYGQYAAKLSSSNDILTPELICQGKAELIKGHILNKRPYKSALLRETLAEGIRLFPENSLFLEVQGMVGAHNRLREAFQAGGAKYQNIGLAAWSHTIAQEIERCNVDAPGSTANSVRALFTRALLDSDSEVKHSPHLWMVWLKFEVALAKGSDMSITGRGTSKLRQVFYDGLRYLPWHKPWILLGMRCLNEFAPDSKMEIRRLYEVMAERDMRIRTHFGGSR